MSGLKIISILLCVIGLSIGGQAQDGSMAVIRKIILEGNDRTKDFILLRELDFVIGDTLVISELQHRFELNEKRLLNTRLFVLAELSTGDWRPGDQYMDITLRVKESWYLLPTPVIKFVDRNIHVWWNEQNRDFQRLIFGVRGRHLNLTGVGDQLRVIAETGFRRQLRLNYRLPYINQSRTLGVDLFTDYVVARNGSYATAEDELLFINDGEEVNFRSLSASSVLRYRPGLLSTHEFSLGFSTNWVSDMVRDLNPLYHQDAQAVQRLFALQYSYTFEGRDRRLQARKGIFLKGRVSQVGLGIYDDVMYGFADLQVKYYHSMSPRWTMRHAAVLRQYYATDKLPYNQVRGIGFGERYIRGYEPYVIDATGYYTLHNGIRFMALDKTLNLSGLLPLKKTDVIPVKVYTSFSLDMGYATDPGYESNNTLDDTWLYGMGPSIEVLLAESYLFGFDVTYNHLNEVGFYIHTKFNF